MSDDELDAQVGGTALDAALKEIAQLRHDLAAMTQARDRALKFISALELMVRAFLHPSQ
jgi:hypothetical protein